MYSKYLNTLAIVCWVFDKKTSVENGSTNSGRVKWKATCELKPN